MSMNVLVLDDDISIGMGLSLSDDECAVTEVTRVGSALVQVRSLQFDAVVCDRRLPDGDGIAFVKLVRTEKVTGEIPIVVLTAGFDEADRAAVMAAGADDYLGKPIEPERLVAALQRAIDNRPEHVVKRTIRSVAADAVPKVDEREVLRQQLDEVRQQAVGAIIDGDRAKAEAQQLRAERDHLAGDAADLRARVTASADDASWVAAENDQLRATVVKLEHRIAQLEAQLRAAAGGPGRERPLRAVRRSGSPA
jgi:DNA-binding response OmpR family regulator